MNDGYGTNLGTFVLDYAATTCPDDEEERDYASRIENHPCPRVRVHPDEECWECDLPDIPKGWSHNGYVQSLMKLRQPCKRKRQTSTLEELMNECKEWEAEMRHREEIDKHIPSQQELDRNIHQDIVDDMKLRNGKTYGEGGESKPKRTPKPRSKRVKPIAKPIACRLHKAPPAPIIDVDADFVPLSVNDNTV